MKGVVTGLQGTDRDIEVGQEDENQIVPFAPGRPGRVGAPALRLSGRGGADAAAHAASNSTSNPAANSASNACADPSPYPRVHLAANAGLQRASYALGRGLTVDRNIQHKVLFSRNAVQGSGGFGGERDSDFERYPLAWIRPEREIFDLVDAGDTTQNRGARRE
ncbi:MAG: hypothetical protein HYY13_05335 [Nitrospirae bacterium]|nr:hypothetical protein [Nitrospirota bacterium]